MTIKALILCGGLGTRLRPLTDQVPKCMVRVQDKPVIDHLLDYLRSYGIRDVAINTHWLATELINYLGDRVLYSYEPELLGTAGTIRKWAKWLGEDFLVMNGDTLTDLDLENFYNFHMKWDEVATVSRNPKNDHCTGAMLFKKKIYGYLPPTGMIDDVLNEISIANYYKCPNYYDIGTPDRLAFAEVNWKGVSRE